MAGGMMQMDLLDLDHRSLLADFMLDPDVLNMQLDLSPTDKEVEQNGESITPNMVIKSDMGMDVKQERLMSSSPEIALASGACMPFSDSANVNLPDSFPSNVQINQLGMEANNMEVANMQQHMQPLQPPALSHMYNNTALPPHVPLPRWALERLAGGGAGGGAPASKMAIGRLPGSRAKATRLVTREERKVVHNEIERRYRNGINDRIAELKILVPSCSDAGPKLKKATILAHAIDYIRDLQGRTATLEMIVCNLQSKLGISEATTTAGIGASAVAAQENNDGARAMATQALGSMGDAADMGDVDPPSPASSHDSGVACSPDSQQSESEDCGETTSTRDSRTQGLFALVAGLTLFGPTMGHLKPAAAFTGAELGRHLSSLTDMNQLLFQRGLTMDIDADAVVRLLAQLWRCVALIVFATFVMRYFLTPPAARVAEAEKLQGRVRSAVDNMNRDKAVLLLKHARGLLVAEWVPLPLVLVTEVCKLCLLRIGLGRIVAMATGTFLAASKTEVEIRMQLRVHDKTMAVTGLAAVCNELAVLNHCLLHSSSQLGAMQGNAAVTAALSLATRVAGRAPYIAARLVDIARCAAVDAEIRSDDKDEATNTVAWILDDAAMPFIFSAPLQTDKLTNGALGVSFAWHLCRRALQSFHTADHTMQLTLGLLQRARRCARALDDGPLEWWTLAALVVAKYRACDCNDGELVALLLALKESCDDGDDTQKLVYSAITGAVSMATGDYCTAAYSAQVAWAIARDAALDSPCASDSDDKLVRRLGIMLALETVLETQYDVWQRVVHTQPALLPNSSGTTAACDTASASEVDDVSSAVGVVMSGALDMLCGLNDASASTSDAAILVYEALTRRVIGADEATTQALLHKAKAVAGVEGFSYLAAFADRHHGIPKQL